MNQNERFSIIVSRADHKLPNMGLMTWK